MALEDIISQDNARENRRFVFRRQLAATFGDVPVTLIDLSRKGAKAEHELPLPPGVEAKIEVLVPGVRTRLSLRAKVIWSQDAGSGARRTGLAITDERFDLAADLLDHMVRLRWVDVERNNDRNARPSARARECSQKTLEQVGRALAFVSRNSGVSRRWRQLVEASAAHTDRHPIEVLSAWELLGRGVALDVVSQVYRERQTFVLDT